MDSKFKLELQATIAKQAEQLKRYESRLRDVVSAYKNLAKQKEALEKNAGGQSVASDSGDGVSVLNITTQSDESASTDNEKLEIDYKTELKIMKDKYENMLEDLRNEMATVNQNHKVEINNLKAKLMYEIQERERDRADQSAMLKEFNLKMSSEKRTKEKDDKSTDSQVSEMEKRIRELHFELEATRRKLHRAETRTAETPQVLVRLKEKIAALEQTHISAIREEQIKAKRAEETARKLLKTQEERVTVLESTLAELSHAVGEYDLLRRKDQKRIELLTATLNAQILGDGYRQVKNDHSSETDNEKIAGVEYLKNLLDKIQILKTELISENHKLGNPIDISAMFSGDSDSLHVNCQAEFNSLKCEYVLLKEKLSKEGLSSQSGPDREERQLRSENRFLKDKIEVLKTELDDLKSQMESKLFDKEKLLQNERTHSAEIATELRNRILLLEKQIQVQRDKYSALLEESEQYIRSRNRLSGGSGGDSKELVTAQEVSGPPHMLHYSHELARKDLDITQLRKEKHHLEGLLRDAQRDRTIEKERYKDIVKSLKDEIDRMRRSQSREGANLEYLKNVVLSYISCTGDKAGKRHMLNAIAAVLHFTEDEKMAVYATI